MRTAAHDARVRVAAFALGLACVGVAMAAGWTPPSITVLPSCTGLPGETCFGDHLNARRLSPDAGLDEDCTTCLQGRACCDLVGTCDSDKECVRGFQATQLCVIDGGPSAEARCKGNLTTPTSRDLYQCMRSSCGPRCGVPNCTLDRAVALFANPECDRCVGGACCEQINECYGSRSCKLIIECVSTHCPHTVGPAMTALGLAPPAVIEQTSARACSGAGGSSPDDPTRCIERCLDEFAPRGDSGTTDDEAARCLAFKVYSCGASQKCGPSCAASDAGPYERQIDWPEDEPPSAGPAPRDASTE
jgi:hypothetical protein